MGQLMASMYRATSIKLNTKSLLMTDWLVKMLTVGQILVSGRVLKCKKQISEFRFAKTMTKRMRRTIKTRKMIAAIKTLRKVRRIMSSVKTKAAQLAGSIICVEPGSRERL